MIRDAMQGLKRILGATRKSGQCTLCGVKENGHAGWCPRRTTTPPTDQKMPPAPPPYLRWEITRDPHAYRPWERH